MKSASIKSAPRHLTHTERLERLINRNARAFRRRRLEGKPVDHILIRSKRLSITYLKALDHHLPSLAIVGLMPTA